MRNPLVPEMLQDLPFSRDELATLIATAPYRYKVYEVPKRRPNEFRTIAQPSKEIKLLQYWLMENVLSKLPVHNAATAYRKGASIESHAALHKKKRFLLKMDFKDFFPSILVNDIEKHLSKYTKLSEEDVRLVSHVVGWRDRSTNKLCLSIGAPSSPLLSNSALYEFDKEISKVARKSGVVYSRYADDLAFSTNRKEMLTEIAHEVERLCKVLDYPRLRINQQKTVFSSKRFRRFLVGLNLTPDGKVSLGREKKRRLRSELYRFAMGRLGVALVPKLRGELAFAWSVEPEFVASLVRQRGAEAFEALGLPFSK